MLLSFAEKDSRMSGANDRLTADALAAATPPLLFSTDDPLDLGREVHDS